jgi:hypothetical protein
VEVVPDIVIVVSVPDCPLTKGPLAPTLIGYGVPETTGTNFLNSVAPAPPPPPALLPPPPPAPPPPTNKISTNPVTAGVKVLAPTVVKACTV